jgi:hypothetical protein
MAEEKNVAAAGLGKLEANKGGKARAKKLIPERRKRDSQESRQRSLGQEASARWFFVDSH